ncbi:hypothetical protein ACIP98_40235 [Streptomyces sp. NPDC088354]|uniref:hypothetical protein n=1 Tax=Streptomyces sp. NPDC088354 TaxID=3365856 RepID=UPI0037FED689
MVSSIAMGGLFIAAGDLGHKFGSQFNFGNFINVVPGGSKAGAVGGGQGRAIRGGTGTGVEPLPATVGGSGVFSGTTGTGDIPAGADFPGAEVPTESGAVPHGTAGTGSGSVRPSVSTSSSPGLASHTGTGTGAGVEGGSRGGQSAGSAGGTQHPAAEQHTHTRPATDDTTDTADSGDSAGSAGTAGMSDAAGVVGSTDATHTVEPDGAPPTTHSPETVGAVDGGGAHGVGSSGPMAGVSGSGVPGSLSVSPGWQAARAGAVVSRSDAWTGVVPAQDTGQAAPVPGAPVQAGPALGAVGSGFDVRRFVHAGEPVVDVTVEVGFSHIGAVTDTEVQAEWERLAAGVEQAFNTSRYPLPSGERLHVTVAPAQPGVRPDLIIEVGSARSERRTPGEYAEQIGRHLGLRPADHGTPAPERAPQAVRTLSSSESDATRPGGVGESGAGPARVRTEGSADAVSPAFVPAGDEVPGAGPATATVSHGDRDGEVSTGTRAGGVGGVRADRASQVPAGLSSGPAPHAPADAPADVLVVGAGGGDGPVRMAGRRELVPGDGRCLLYSVLVGMEPDVWPVGLGGDPGGRHAAVVRQLETFEREGDRLVGRVGEATPLGRAAQDLHGLVVGYVRDAGPGGVPAEVVRQYRTGEEQLGRLRESTERLFTRIAQGGVPRAATPGDRLALRALRALHDKTMRERGVAGSGQPAVGSLDQFGDLVEYFSGDGGSDIVPRMVDAAVDGALDLPLDRHEFAGLEASLRRWQPNTSTWSSDEGEMFPGLVAHALGIRLRTFTGTTLIAQAGPQHATRSVDVHYNGRTHYDAVTPPTPTNTTGSVTPVPFAGERGHELTAEGPGVVRAVGQYIADEDRARGKHTPEDLPSRHPAWGQQSFVPSGRPPHDWRGLLDTGLPTTTGWNHRPYVWMAATRNESADALDQGILRDRLSQLVPGSAEYDRVDRALRTHNAGDPGNLAQQATTLPATREEDHTEVPPGDTHHDTAGPTTKPAPNDPTGNAPHTTKKNTPRPSTPTADDATPIADRGDDTTAAVTDDPATSLTVTAKDLTGIALPPNSPAASAWALNPDVAFTVGELRLDQTATDALLVHLAHRPIANNTPTTTNARHNTDTESKATPYTRSPSEATMTGGVPTAEFLTISPLVEGYSGTSSWTGQIKTGEYFGAPYEDDIDSLSDIPVQPGWRQGPRTQPPRPALASGTSSTSHDSSSVADRPLRLEPNPAPMVATAEGAPEGSATRGGGDATLTGQHLQPTPAPPPAVPETDIPVLATTVAEAETAPVVRPVVTSAGAVGPESPERELAKSPPAPETELRIGAAVSVHPMARFSAVPRKGLPLPGMADLVEKLRADLKAQFSAAGLAPLSAEDEHTLAMLHVKLEQNFRYLITARPEEISGFVTRIGGAEVLFTIDPQNPVLVHSELAAKDDPKAPKGTATSTSTFNTGSFSHNATVNRTAYSGALSLSGGIDLGTGVADALSLGASVGLTRNAKHDGTNTAHFVESGHVSNHRTGNSLVAYDLNLSYRIRVDTGIPWKKIVANKLSNGDEKVFLWLADRFLGSPPRSTTVNSGVDNIQIPDMHMALALTRMPELYDAVLLGLRQKWSAKLGSRYLRVGSWVSDELLQGLYNYHTNFEHATGGGFKFYLHASRGGRTIAAIRLTSEILTPEKARARGLAPVNMFGATPKNNANIETVHTILHATGASHKVSQEQSASVWAKADLAPSLGKGGKLGVGIKASAGVSKERSRGTSGSYDGLKVTVYRNIGPNPFYAVPVEHTIHVQVREPDSTLRDVQPIPDVSAEVSLTMPQSDAFTHGFPVDSEMIEGGALRGSAPVSDAVPPRQAPAYLRTGVGLSRVHVAPETVTEIGDHIRTVLREKGYLPDPENVFAGVSWFPKQTDAKIQAEKTLDNWLLGMGDYMNAMMTDDGNTIRLKRIGVGTEEYVNVTLKARFDVKDVRYQGATAEERLALLLMALRIASQSSAGAERISGGITAGIIYKALKNFGVDFGASWSKTSSLGEVQVFNHPVLFEATGDLLKFRINKLIFTLEIAEGVNGVLGHRIGGVTDGIHTHSWPDQSADLLVSDLPVDVPERLPSTGETLPEVFEQAVIVHLDTNGVTGSVQSLLPADLQGPGSATADAFRQLTLHETLVAQFPHMLQGAGHFDLDSGSEYGLLKNAYSVLSGKAKVMEATFLGATAEPVVLAQIALLQAQANSGQSQSLQIGVGPAGVSVGGPAGDATASGSFGAGLSIARGMSWSQTLTGGFEQIALAIGTGYLYAANSEMTFSVGWFKNGTFVRTDKGNGTTAPRLRQTIFIVSEHDALSFYADNELPVSDERLAEVVTQWHSPKPPSSSTLMARLLLRWLDDRTGLPEGTDLERLAEVVRGRHNATRPQVRNRILDRKVLQRFNEAFPDQSVEPVELRPPSYLAASYEPHRLIGPAAISGIRYEDGRTLWDTVRELVEQVAPGLLSTSPLVKSVHGRRQGKVHGGLMTLQTIFSTRSAILYLDLLDENGVEISLPHPKGPLYEDVVIRVSTLLTGAAEAHQERNDASLEFFLHGQNAKTVSQNGSRTVKTSANFAPGGPAFSGATAVESFLGGSSEVALNETQYWESIFGDDGWQVEFEARMRTRVEVGLRDVPRSDFNNALMRADRLLADRSPVVRFLSGTMKISVPGSMTTMGPKKEYMYKLPSSIPVDLPVNKHPVGFLLTGGRHRQIGSFLKAMYGDRVMVKGGHGDTFLPAMTSQSMLTAQAVRRQTRDYQLSAGYAPPASPLKRARITMDTQFTDLRVLDEFDGAGFGTYFKYITAVTTARQTSHGAAFKADLSNQGDFPKTHDSHGEGTSLQYSAAGDVKAAHQDQPRTEAFAKESKRIFYIAVTGSFRLHAKLTQGHLMFGRRPTPRGTFSSQRFTGEMHLLVNEDDYRGMAESLREHRKLNADTVQSWDRDPKSVQHFDLAGILVEIARDSRAHAGVAPALVARAIDDRMFHGNQRLTGPRKLQKRANRNRPRITDSRRLVLEFDADRVAQMPGAAPVLVFEEPGPGVLGPDQPVLSSNVIHLTSRVAMTLNAYVELKIVRNGKLDRWWFHPKGRIFAFDPEGRTDDAPLFLDDAVNRRILTRELAREAQIWGLEPKDIGQLERTSYSRDLTLGQAVQEKVDEWHERLDTIDQDLCEILETTHLIHQALSTSQILTDGDQQLQRSTAEAVQALRDAARGNRELSGDDVERFRQTRSRAGEQFVVASDGTAHDEALPSPLPSADGRYLPPEGKAGVSHARADKDRYGNLLPLPGDPAAPDIPLQLLTFDFARHSLRLRNPGFNQIDELATRIREAIRHRSQRGLSKPAITISAGGNGSWLLGGGSRSRRAEETGRARGEAVLEYLRRALGTDAANVRFDSLVNRGRNLSDATTAEQQQLAKGKRRRRTVVEVRFDDGPATPKETHLDVKGSLPSISEEEESGPRPLTESRAELGPDVSAGPLPSEPELRGSGGEITSPAPPGSTIPRSGIAGPVKYPDEPQPAGLDATMGSSEVPGAMARTTPARMDLDTLAKFNVTPTLGQKAEALLLGGPAPEVELSSEQRAQVSAYSAGPTDRSPSQDAASGGGHLPSGDLVPGAEDRRGAGSARAEDVALPPGERLRVLSRGLCLLHSVLAGMPPQLWPLGLHDGYPGGAHARHQAVVRGVEGGGLDDVALSAATDALRQMVQQYVQNRGRSGIPLEAIVPFRRTETETRRRWELLTSLSDDELRQRMRSTGVQSITSSGWLSPQALRDLYVRTRARKLVEASGPFPSSPQAAAMLAASEVPVTTVTPGSWKLDDTALGVEAQFAYVTEHAVGGLPLELIDSRDLLIGAAVDATAREPLSDQEYRALNAAVRAWAWATDEGEMFPALVAHTLGVRLHAFYEAGGRTELWSTLGPQASSGSVSVYYNGFDHYDAVRISATVPPVAEGAGPQHAGGFEQDPDY